jgi:hypothetical protein
MKDKEEIEKKNEMNKISGSHGGEYEDDLSSGMLRHHQTLMMEAASTSVTSETFDQTTRYIPEDSLLQIH